MECRFSCWLAVVRASGILHLGTNGEIPEYLHTYVTFL